MEYPYYLALYYYITEGRYPNGADESTKRKLRYQAQRLEAYRGKLYRKTDDPTFFGPEVLHEGNIEEVVKQVHNEGHFGEIRTWQRIRENFWSPGLSKYVKEFVKGCQTCQFRQRVPRRRYAQANPIQTPTRPFFMIGCDAVGPTLEPTRHGNRYLLVAIDYLTRWPVAAAVPNINEETTADFLFNQVVKMYGVPSYILTDRGSNFTSEFVREFLRDMGCRHITTTAYRPQSNGLCERLNQTLTQTIAKIARDDDKTDRWDEYVDMALLAIRTMPNESTRFSPSMLLFGYELHTPATWPAPRIDYVEGEIEVEIAQRTQVIKHLSDTSREQARMRVKERQARDKRRYDQLVAPRKRFRVGEQVLMRDKAPVGKFSDRWIGPLVVTKVNSLGTYHLAGPSSRKLDGAVHGDMLVPYYQRKNMVPDVQVQRAAQKFQAWISRSRME